MPTSTYPTDGRVAVEVIHHQAEVDTVDVQLLDATIGAERVAVAFDGTAASIRLTGRLGDVYRLVIEADRQLAALARVEG